MPAPIVPISAENCLTLDGWTLVYGIGTYLCTVCTFFVSIKALFSLYHSKGILLKLRILGGIFYSLALLTTICLSLIITLCEFIDATKNYTHFRTFLVIGYGMWMTAIIILYSIFVHRLYESFLHSIYAVSKTLKCGLFVPLWMLVICAGVSQWSIVDQGYREYRMTIVASAIFFASSLIIMILFIQRLFALEAMLAHAERYMSHGPRDSNSNNSNNHNNNNNNNKRYSNSSQLRVHINTKKIVKKVTNGDATTPQSGPVCNPSQKIKLQPIESNTHGIEQTKKNIEDMIKNTNDFNSFNNINNSNNNDINNNNNNNNNEKKENSKINTQKQPKKNEATKGRLHSSTPSGALSPTDIGFDSDTEDDVRYDIRKDTEDIIMDTIAEENNNNNNEEEIEPQKRQSSFRIHNVDIINGVTVSPGQKEILNTITNQAVTTITGLITCCIVAACGIVNVLEPDRHARSFAVFVGDFALFIGCLVLFLQFNFGMKWYDLLCKPCHNFTLNKCVIRKARGLERVSSAH